MNRVFQYITAFDTATELAKYCVTLMTKYFASANIIQPPAPNIQIQTLQIQTLLRVTRVTE